MPKFEVTENREIVIRLTKQEAAQLKNQVEDLDAIEHTIETGGLIKQIHGKLVDALFQAMRETNWQGPV
jgi:hypothetical protein